MRALAAMQVTLTHFAAAFLPTLAFVPGRTHYGWERAVLRSPAFFLLNRYVAIDLFFLLSGFVLAQSFLVPGRTFGPGAVKRVLRLVLPVLAAVVLASGLLAVFPSERHQAALLSGSGWLDQLYLGPGNLFSGLTGALGTVVVGGYGVGVFAHVAGLAPHLPVFPVPDSLDPPIWYLNWELWGSLLLLALAGTYRRVPRKLFWTIFAVGMGALATNPLGLLMIGFVAYLARDRLLRLRGPIAGATGLALVAGGVAVSVMAIRAMPGPAGGPLPPIAGLNVTLDDLNGAAAILVFAGVLMNAGLRRALSLRPMPRLGRLALSAYLVHVPILVTVGCLVFRVAQPLGYLPAAGLATVTGLACTLGASVVFERVADRPSVAGAGWVGNRLQRARFRMAS
ncbi:MAG: hypothetical protein NVSMB32_11820 [Actinomycetota bacterium]